MAGAIFLLLNLDILKCLITPKFFIPLESQEGHTSVHDNIFRMNLFSLIKLIILNFYSLLV